MILLDLQNSLMIDLPNMKNLELPDKQLICHDTSSSVKELTL